MLDTSRPTSAVRRSLKIASTSVDGSSEAETEYMSVKTRSSSDASENSGLAGATEGDNAVGADKECGALHGRNQSSQGGKANGSVLSLLESMKVSLANVAEGQSRRRASQVSTLTINLPHIRLSDAQTAKELASG